MTVLSYVMVYAGSALMVFNMDRMGGTIDVETEKGKGTKFILHLTFPLASAEDVVAARDSGMNAHISKPLDLKEMFSTLQNVLKVE